MRKTRGPGEFSGGPRFRPGAAPGEGPAVPRPLLVLYRALLVLALGLGLFILGGSLYAAFRGNRAESGEPGPESAGGSAGDQAGPPAAAGEAVFTGIGRLRIPLAPAAGGNTAGGAASSTGPETIGAAGQNPGDSRAALIISIAFPYDPGDRAFSEELASKAGEFRRIARDYFSSRSVEELRGMDETPMKAGLLEAYNSALRLGKIRALYFYDLLLFE
jgi:flagellar basal body-associated protein FliL